MKKFPFWILFPLLVACNRNPEPKQPLNNIPAAEDLRPFFYVEPISKKKAALPETILPFKLKTKTSQFVLDLQINPLDIVLNLEYGYKEGNISEFRKDSLYGRDGCMLKLWAADSEGNLIWSETRRPFPSWLDGTLEERISLCNFYPLPPGKQSIILGAELLGKTDRKVLDFAIKVDIVVPKVARTDLFVRYIKAAADVRDNNFAAIGNEPDLMLAIYFSDKKATYSKHRIDKLFPDNTSGMSGDPKIDKMVIYHPADYQYIRLEACERNVFKTKTLDIWDIEIGTFARDTTIAISGENIDNLTIRGLHQGLAN